MEHTIHGLIKKRGAIACYHKLAVKAADVLKADLAEIDRALVLVDYKDEPQAAIPTRQGSSFSKNVSICARRRD